MDLRARFDTVGGTPVVTLDGLIDLASVPALHDHLTRLILQHPGVVVAVDVDAVLAIDDCGLGLLLGAAGRARQHHGDLVVITGSERHLARFASTRFDHAVRVHPSIGAAVAEHDTSDHDTSVHDTSDHDTSVHDTNDNDPDIAIFHAALPDDWTAARAVGRYTTSTRGVSLDDEGFIHCSYRHQVEGVANRFYGDVAELVLLAIDPAALEAPVIAEPPADGIDELFPHVYGPIPLAAVTAASVWHRSPDGTFRL
jgi:anti-anti-sigma factor